MAFARKLRKNLPAITEHAADMPILLHKVLRDATEGNLEVNWKSEQLTELREELKENNRTTITAIAGGAMLISGTSLLALVPSILLSATLTTTIGMALAGTGLLLLLQAWLSSR
jgi:ubiquinone biosynthesis protein